ncbi:SDR family NAD(P)-dependent oxidoreductase, partial [Chlamydiota bacterium]
VGESDYSVVAGVSLDLHPLKYISFSKSRMLSPEGQCKTFDKDANGYVPGEGVGVLILQRLEDAINDGNHIYGVIRGSAVNHGGQTLSITAPRVESQRDVILDAYKDAGFSAKETSYVEAHGTGTSLGDPIEIESLTQAFREYTNESGYCKIGSVKSNIGHLEAAAGVASIIKVLMMFKHEQIPPSINIKHINPIIKFAGSPFRVARTLDDWKKDKEEKMLKAGVSSFGFGGVNSHILLEEFPEKEKEKHKKTDDFHIFILSAKSQLSLKKLLDKWKEFVEGEDFEKESLWDLCGTLLRGRERLPHRYGCVVHNKDELKEVIREVTVSETRREKKQWCLKIGSITWNGYEEVRGLFEDNNFFKDVLEKLLTELRTNAIREKVLRGLKNKAWEEESKKVFSFIISYAYLQGLQELGFNPDLIMSEERGIYLGLAISKMASFSDIAKVLLGVKKLKDIVLKRPEIPFYDSVNEKTITRYLMDDDYVRFLGKAREFEEKDIFSQILMEEMTDTLSHGNRRHFGEEKKRIGEILLDKNRISLKQLGDALTEQKRHSRLLGKILIDKGYCTDDDIEQALKEQNILLERGPNNSTKLGELLVSKDIITIDELEDALQEKQKTGRMLGTILLRKGYCDLEDMKKVLNHQDVVRNYLVEARLLIETQFTFKKYMEEWNLVLRRFGKDIIKMVYDYQRLFHDESEAVKREKLLLIIIVMSSMYRLNRKWALTEEQLMPDQRFYELLDLVVDEVMTKERLIELLLEKSPDYNAMANEMQTRQYLMNKANPYKYITEKNKKVREIENVEDWIEQCIQKEDDFEDKKNFEIVSFGQKKEKINENVIVGLDIKSGHEHFLKNVLDLWLHGVSISWEKLYKGSIFNRVILPTYAFDRSAFWLKGEKNTENSEKKVLEERKNSEKEPDREELEEPISASKVVKLEGNGGRYIRKYTLLDQIIQDHVITGTPIIPGASMIDMGFEIIKAHRGHDINMLENVILSSPGIVQDDLLVEGRIDEDRNGFQLIFSGRELCRGNFGYAQFQSHAGPDIASFQRKEENVIQRLYKKLLEMGYGYGEGLRVIQGIWENDNEYLFELKKPLQDEGIVSKINPRGLDGIFQSIITTQILENTISEENIIYIPYIIKKLHFANSEMGRCLVSIAKNEIKRIGDDFSVRVKTYSAQERGYDMPTRSVLHIEDMIFKKAMRNFLMPHLQKGESIAEKKSESPVFYYTPRWEKYEIKKHEDKIDEKTVLLFSEENELSQALYDDVKRENKIVYRVLEGQNYSKIEERYQIDSLNEDDYRKVIEDVINKSEEKNTILIYYLWKEKSDSNKDSTNSGEKVKNWMQKIFYLVKTLSKMRLQNEATIIIRTESTNSVLSEDKCEGYWYGAIHGFIKTVMLENTKIKMKVVDFDGTDKEIRKKTDLFVKEAKSGQEEIVAYRRDERYVRIFDKTSIENQTSESILKDGGVYVLLGGTGGIGMKLAERIAQEVNATIILTDIAEIKEEKQKQIDAIKGYGSEIICLVGDLTKREDVQRIVNEIKEKYGNINGVIQLAGILRDKLLASKEWETFWQVMAPKVIGTVNINEATKNEPLDFFVTFSSVVAVMGNIGQSDYGSANSFMDSFIHYRNKNEFPGRAYSLNWTLWSDGGMGLSEAVEKQIARIGLGAISGKEGIDSLMDVINSDRSQVVVVKGESQKIGKRLNAGIKEKNSCQKIEMKKELLREKQEERGMFFDKKSQQENDVESAILSIISKILSVNPDEIDKDTDLAEYGVDSMAIMEIVEKLSTIYGDHIHHSIIMENPTINLLVKYIGKNISELIQPSLSQENTIELEVKTTVNKTPIEAVGIGQDKELTQWIGLYDQIAIIGMAGRFPGSQNIEDYWQNLKRGKNLISEIPPERFFIDDYFTNEQGVINKTYSRVGGFLNDVAGFGATFFNIKDDEAINMDPQQRIFLEITQELFDRAGYTKKDIGGSTTGVYIGCHESNYGRKNNKRAKFYGKSGVVNVISNMIAGRVMQFYDLRGPSQIVYTACSSSLVAIHNAIQAIKAGECELAVAGGIELLLDEEWFIGFSEMKVLSPDGKCKVFDRNANGFVLGEGAGAVLLKRLDKALEDGDQILAVIRGSAVNNDGKTMGLTTPNMESQKAVIKKAIENAHVDPKTITYYEAHGTGTQLGDPIEIKGATQVFREYTNEVGYCAVGSVKANVGHLLAAAGIASVIKVLLALKHKEIPPTINCIEPHPRFEFENSPFFPIMKLTPWEEKENTRNAGISSFGFGGINSHLIIEEFHADDAKYKPQKHPLVLTQFKRKHYWIDEPIVDCQEGIIKKIFQLVSLGKISIDDAKQRLNKQNIKINFEKVS